MRHSHLGLLVVLMLTGCPSEFGKHGRISKAVHQDVLELHRKHCDAETYKEVCGGNKKHSQECHDTCGE